MVKQQMVEVVLKTADGKNQATAMVAFQCKDGTCSGTIISIAAKTPNANFSIVVGNIGFGTSAEITMSPGSVNGKCVDGKCVYTISASWTIRAKLYIFIQWYDRSRTFIGTGKFTSNCVCGG